jgi:DNA repair protein RadC
MTVGAEGHRKRLRERFEWSGLEGFHDHEVLELLLSYAIPRRDVKPLAKQLLAEFGSLASVLDTPLATLKKISGVGPHAAVLLTLLPRLLVRYRQDRWKQNPTFSSTQEAVAYLSSILGTLRNEVFCILALDSTNSMLAMEQVQEGSVNRTAVFPRLVAEACLKHRATAVILAHNHPGGDPSPSAADKQLTRKLKRVLTDLDIQVHDHIIVAGVNHFSFAEHGEME